MEGAGFGRARRVLVVDGDAPWRAALAAAFDRAGFVAEIASGVEEGTTKLRHQVPAAVIVDADLPDGAGLYVCYRAASFTGATVIVTSRRDTESDAIVARELGAAAFLAKPCAPAELVVRALELVAHTPSHVAPQTTLELGAIRIDTAARSVHVGRRRVALTGKEFDLLRLLVARDGGVVTHDEILDAVWGPDFSGDPHTVVVHVRRLRNKLGRTPPTIVTVRGHGYRVEREASAREVAHVS